MSLHTLIDNRKAGPRVWRPAGCRRRMTYRTGRIFQPRWDVCEDRTLLSLISWTGGAGDNKKIAEWLRSGPILPTVVGELSLDRKGDVTDPKYVWYRWRGGSFNEDAALNR